MKFEDYEKEAAKTAVYPGVGTGSIEAIQYCALGVTGEAGEFANKIKKLTRDSDTPEARAAALDELGDDLYYLARSAAELGSSLELVAVRNIQKIHRRRLNGTIHGQGDAR